jgi:hypothetical protein
MAKKKIPTPEEYFRSVPTPQEYFASKKKNQEEESISKVGSLSTSDIDQMRYTAEASTTSREPVIPEQILQQSQYVTNLQNVARETKNPLIKDVSLKISQETERLGGGILKFIGDAIPGDDVVDELAQNSDLWVENYTNQMTRGNESISGKWKSGDKKGAIEEGVVQMLGQTPQLILMAAGGQLGLGVLGTSVYGQKYDELKEIKGNEFLKRINALSTAIAEVGTEKLTTMPLLNGAKKAVLNLGAEQAKPIVQQSVSKVVKDFFASTGYKLGQAASEAVSEMASQEAEAIIDYVTNAKDSYVPFDTPTIDAGIIGFGVGGGLVAPSVASDIKAAVSSIPKGYSMQQKAKIAEKIVERDNLEKEIEQTDDAFVKDVEKKKKRVENINETISNIDPENKDAKSSIEALSPPSEGKPPKEEKVSKTEPTVSKKELPENVIETGEGLFELNPGQVKQRKEMQEKYGKEKADELIAGFIDTSNLRKYTKDPTKIEKDDKKDKTGIPSEKQVGEKPIEETGGKEEKTGGVLQEEKIDIAFDFAGNRRFGKIVEKTEDAIKVEESGGIKHTIPIKGSSFYKNIEQNVEAITKEYEQRKTEDSKERASQFANREIIKKESQPKTLGLSTKLKAGNIFREMFQIDRGGIKGTARANIKMKGKIAAEERKAKINTREYSDAVKQVYGDKISSKDAEKLNNVMGMMGDNPSIALQNVDERLHEPLIKMRNHIDYMTSQLKEIPWLSKRLKIIFDANTGYYMTRSYQSKTNKKWKYDNIPVDIKERAFKAVVDNFPELTDNQVEGFLKSMLEDDAVSNMFGDATLGKMNLGVTKARSQFLTDNPSIRDFLGEYKDPVINYTTSIAKMSQLLEKHKLLTDLTKMGLEQGVLSEELTDKHDVKIGIQHPLSVTMKEGEPVIYEREGKNVLKPINEYYATPEVKKAIEGFEPVYNSIQNKLLGGLYKGYLAGTTAIKAAKTAGSVKGIVRNFLSNPINLLSNFNFNLKNTFKNIPVDFKDIAKNRKKFREDFDKMMIELNEEAVVGGNIDKRAYEENIRDISRNKKIIEDFTDTTAKKLAKAPVRMAWKAFGFGDDFWKAVRYYNEKSLYKDVYKKKGMKEEDAEAAARTKASEILHKTQAFYDLLPQFAMAMRKAPVSGSFISFPYVTTMNMFNTIDLAFKEMKDPDTKSIGIQRIIGTAAALSVLPTIALMMNTSADVDNDELEALRRFIPSYWRNDVIGIKKKKGNGNYVYNNLSFLDYYGAVTKPIITFYRDAMANGGVDKGVLFNAVGEFIEPYTDPEISARILSELALNRSQRTGEKIYNTKDTNFINDVLKYVWEEGLQPGTITDIRTIKRLKRDDRDWKQHLKGMLTGNQNRNLDVKKAFRSYNMPEHMDDIAFYVKKYREAKYKESENKSLKTLVDANDGIDQVIEEARKDYNALMILNVSPDEAKKLLKNSYYEGKKIQSIIVDAVSKGRNIRLNEDGRLVKE